MAGEFQVTLQGGAPWGFRLQGGKEFRSPLRIAKVEPTGKAGRADVKIGDHVTIINGVSTAELYHTEALSSVKRAGATLELCLFRPDGDELSHSSNSLAPQTRTGTSTTVQSRSIISSTGSLGGGIDLSPTSGSLSYRGSSELLNGGGSVSEKNEHNSISSRSYGAYPDVTNANGYRNEQSQWSPDIINAAVATPGQISMDRDYSSGRQSYSTSSSEDRDDSTASQGRSTTLPRRPPTNPSHPPRQLSADARARTLPRKSSSGAGRTPDWYKQMYKEMHASMDAGASHLGVLLASDAAKGAFRSYDGATSPGGNRSQSPETASGASYGPPPDVLAQRRISASSTEFRSSRSSASNPNRKSMPNINTNDIPTRSGTAKPVKSSWYREMQRGGEIPAAGLSSTLPANKEKKVFVFNNETKEIKPAPPPVKARISRPPPTRGNSRPEKFEYNNPPDLLDLRRREEASGMRQQEVDSEYLSQEDERRLRRERELEEQAKVELLRQQEEQEFELERQAEMERKRLEREKKRVEEEQRQQEEQRREAGRLAEEERQRKIQEQQRKEEIERKEAKRLLDEQRQHEEQRRLNERKRQEEERRRDDERRRQEEEQRQRNIQKQEEERQKELQRKQQQEEERQRELRRQEEIRRKEEEERLQAEELKRIAAIENSIKSQDELQENSDEEQLAKALYSFKPQSDSELTFRKGDTIRILGRVDENWFEGELDGVIGIFPSNYVELLEIVKEPEPQQVEIQIEEGLAKARYTFKAESPKELAFKKNDMIVLLRQIDENWYEGEVGETIGIFPSAYVEVINEPRVIEVETQPNRNAAVIPSGKSSRDHHGQMEVITTTVEQNNFSAPEPQFDLDVDLPSKQNGDLSLPQGERHRAKFGYRPMNQDELELREGDSVMVLEKCDDGWFVGTCERTGQFGTFPGNYVIPM